MFTFDSDCTVICRCAASTALCLTSATGLTTWHVPNHVTECTVICRCAASTALCLTSATGLTSWHVPNHVTECTVICRCAVSTALCLTSATGLTSWHVPNHVTECLPKQADAGLLQSRLLSAPQTSAYWRTTCPCCWKKCCRRHRGPEFQPFSCTGCNEVKIWRVLRQLMWRRLVW